MPESKKSEEKDYRLKAKSRTRSTSNPWSGTIGSHYLNILTAWTFSTVPMTILAVALVVIVDRSKPRSSPLGSFYSDGSQANSSLGSALYSKIPSTQLTFIASFSSTLATTVLPAVMALLSYTVALAVTRDSDEETWQRLPSPYQLELLISTLNGSLLAFWSFAIYVLGPKRRRIAVVPHVWKATMVLGIMAILA